MRHEQVIRSYRAGYEKKDWTISGECYFGGQAGYPSTAAG